MDVIRLQNIEASLRRADDPTEVTITALAVGVGKTHRLATGQIVTWTAEFLREKAASFVGKPINVDLDEDGKPTGHSRRVVGAVTKAWFDEARQGVMVEGAIWPHYAPSTVAQLKKLGPDRLQVSMELIPESEMVANNDGSVTPVDGEFSGLGIVGIGADPRNRVFLLAALAEDQAAEGNMKIDDILATVRDRFGLTEVKTPEQERDDINAELSAAHEGSFEWVSRRLTEHLMSRRSVDDYTYSYVIATYPKYAIYQEGENYYRIEYARKGRDINFEEPTEVDPTYNPVEASASADEDAVSAQKEVAELGTELSEEQKAELRAELLAELKPQLDELEAVKAENTELKADKATRDAADAKKELVATRLAELEAIRPAEGAGKERREALCAALDDDAFAAYKAEIADAAEVKGGLATDAARHEGTEDDKPLVTADEAKEMAERAIAAAGYAAPAEDK